MRSAADDGWGPATAVQSSSAQRASQHQRQAPVRLPDLRDQPRRGGAADARPAEHAPVHGHRLQARATQSPAAIPQGRGLPGWAALVVLIVVAGIGGIIDTASGTQSRGGFNIGIIVASIVAILVVRRSSMFPVVVAPPIVYAIASGGMLYVRSNGLHDHKVLFDGAANWLVYGFPAMAAATAAVLIIAGIRMITNR
jgi:hypothetical protein